MALAALEQRVRAWTRDDEVAAQTCAEILRTFNLTRGGAAFEGFVQGRFVEVARRRERDERDEQDGRGERLSRCLEELRARNARHHGAIRLLYEDRATVPEAADVLTVDAWTVRTLAARARQALAQCLGRADRRAAPRAGGKPGRSAGRPSPRRGRPPPRRRAE